MYSVNPSNISIKLIMSSFIIQSHFQNKNAINRIVIFFFQLVTERNRIMDSMQSAELQIVIRFRYSRFLSPTCVYKSHLSLLSNNVLLNRKLFKFA
jgi:hypothetical protein